MLAKAALDPHASADMKGRELSGVDPITDRLLIELQDARNLCHRHVLIRHRCVSAGMGQP
jgi:hypothetical protein